MFLAPPTRPLDPLLNIAKQECILLGCTPSPLVAPLDISQREGAHTSPPLEADPILLWHQRQEVTSYTHSPEQNDRRL